MAPYAVPPFYDSLLAKIIVHGRDRAEAIARMRGALAETVVEGVKTTIPFHLRVLADPAFVEGGFTQRRRRPPHQGLGWIPRCTSCWTAPRPAGATSSSSWR